MDITVDERLNAVASRGYLISVAQVDQRTKRKYREGLLPPTLVKVSVVLLGSALGTLFERRYTTWSEALLAGVTFAERDLQAKESSVVDRNKLLAAPVDHGYDPSLWEPGYPGYPKGSIDHSAYCVHGGVRTNLAMLPDDTVVQLHGTGSRALISSDETRKYMVYVFEGMLGGTVVFDGDHWADVTVE